MLTLSLGRGKSLSPFIPSGTMLTILPFKPKDLCLGRLVAYCGKGEWVCHRIVGIRRENHLNWYFLKGDGNFFPDGWVPEYRIQGMVEVWGVSPMRIGLGVAYSFLSLAVWWLRCRTIVGRRGGEIISSLRQYLRGRPQISPLADYGHAYHYDALFAGDGEDINAALALCQSPSKILDLGGGMGRVSKALSLAGHDVTLVDASESMLAYARDKAENVPFLIENQRAEKLNLNKRFDAVFAINYLFEHLENDQAVLQTLERIKIHLEPGASLYIDLHNPEHAATELGWLKNRWVFTRQVKIDGMGHRVWAKTSPGDFPGKINCEHAIERRVLFWKHLKTSLRLLTQEKWETLFVRSGYKINNCWGNWKFDSVNSANPKMIFHLTVSL